MNNEHGTVARGPELHSRDDTTTQHLLLTVLGIDPQPACYTLGERHAKAKFAPVALLELLPDTERPDLVLALCTPEAKTKSWPGFERALEGKCEATCVDVSSGNSQEDVTCYLAKIAGSIPRDGEVDLTVDVTHGFRHFSFLTYIAVLYLAVLRGTRVRGAYYGLRQQGAPSPFLDLRPLLEFPRWLHALETLRETGSTAPLAEALREGPRGQSSRRVAGADVVARDFARDLTQLSEGYLSGLPLELGRDVRRFREQRIKRLKKLLGCEHRLPLAEELVERLDAIIEPFASCDPVSGDGWKKRVVLSEHELRRQAKLIDDLLARGHLANALGLMNEWTISWVVWRTTGDVRERWLDFKKERREASGLLGAIEAVGKDQQLRNVLTEHQHSLGKFWRNVCNLRNAYHHHGMRPQVLAGDNKQFKKAFEYVRTFWRETLRSCPETDLSLGGSPHGRGRVLVSPIGLRPGVLFSALHACRSGGDTGEPTVCLVICSRETEPLIDEAKCRAEYKGAIEPLRLEDPHGGGPEIERLAKATRGHFVGATDVLVNVTGGTTLMGLTAEALAKEARSLACPVRRFGLIDRRPPQDQNADPYRVGEPFWLDAAPE